MRSEDKEYRGGWRQAQHSHVNFDLVLLAQVWPQKQVLDSSMLHLKASTLWGRERIITLALNFFFPFFFCLHLSTSNCIYLFGSHSFIHSLTHILSYFRKYFVQGAQLSSNVTNLQDPEGMQVDGQNVGLLGWRSYLEAGGRGQVG